MSEGSVAASSILYEHNRADVRRRQGGRGVGAKDDSPAAATSRSSLVSPPRSHLLAAAACDQILMPDRQPFPHYFPRHARLWDAHSPSLSSQSAVLAPSRSMLCLFFLPLLLALYLSHALTTPLKAPRMAFLRGAGLSEVIGREVRRG